MDLEKPKLLRTYTIISPNDEYNILNGKCPNYALNWGIKRNLDYWVEGHDFISGKYNLYKDYKRGVTLDEYERIRYEKNEYEKYISQETKNIFKSKREKLKKEMKKYLSSPIYNENTDTIYSAKLE
jgi:hypothetical protein